jgi:hypothetical protein
MPLEGYLRHKILTYCLAIFIAAGTLTAQQGTAASAEQFLGTWTGTWNGGGLSRSVELTVERENDGATVARVVVSGDPSYQARLAQVAFEGAKMTGQYDFPPQPDTEVVLVASFDGSVATGTWSLREKASGFEVVSGSLKVTKN